MPAQGTCGTPRSRSASARTTTCSRSTAPITRSTASCDRRGRPFRAPTAPARPPSTSASRSWGSSPTPSAGACARPCWRSAPWSSCTGSWPPCATPSAAPTTRTRCRSCATRPPGCNASSTPSARRAWPSDEKYVADERALGAGRSRLALRRGRGGGVPFSRVKELFAEQVEARPATSASRALSERARQRVPFRGRRVRRRSGDAAARHRPVRQPLRHGLHQRARLRALFRAQRGQLAVLRTRRRTWPTASTAWI